MCFDIFTAEIKHTLQKLNYLMHLKIPLLGNKEIKFTKNTFSVFNENQKWALEGYSYKVMRSLLSFILVKDNLEYSKKWIDWDYNEKWSYISIIITIFLPSSQKSKAHHLTIMKEITDM